MGPKKKKNPKNDFYFFMQEQKAELRKEGRVWNTMDELVAICHPRFKALTEPEKQRFKNMAKQWKEMDKKDLSNKFDSQGRCLLDIENEQKEKETYYNKMVQDITQTVESHSEKRTLNDKKFYFVHVNTLCETIEKQHLPCELAVAEFSLNEGVSRYLHAFIRPQEIPIGYGYKILENAKNTHLIDLDVNPLKDKAASSYSWILRRLRSMMSQSDDPKAVPPLYTIEGEFEKTTSVLNDLLSWDDSAKPIFDELKVYFLHELYYSLTQYLPQQEGRFKSKALAASRLTQDAFIYTLDNACLFHEELDRSRFCSLFHVRKWAYLLSEHCCPYMGIPLIPGRHQPPDSDTGEERKDPEQVKVVFDGSEEIWTDGLEEHDGEFHTITGVRKTKAQPAGMTFPIQEEPVWEKGSSGLFQEEREILAEAGRQRSRNVDFPESSQEEFQTTVDDWYDLPQSLSKASGNAPSQRGRTAWGSASGTPWASMNKERQKPSIESEQEFPSLGAVGSARGKSRGAARGRRGRGGTIKQLEESFQRANLRN